MKAAGHKKPSPAPIPLLALLQKRIDGDRALLQLASLRFRQAGMGAEFYAETTDELEWLMKFRPSVDLPVMVHLPRWINLFEEASRQLIREFAARFRGRIAGLIAHDQQEIISNFDGYLTALRKLDKELTNIVDAPSVFVEYATGLDTELFVKLHHSARSLERIRACLDVGHIGIWHARRIFSRRHPEKNVCDLSPGDPGLPELMRDVQQAVESALEEIRRVIREFGRLKKPVHFHLHDGHPLSKSSPFGVSDHGSFLGQIPLPFDYDGKRLLPYMFGPTGLSTIVDESVRAIGPGELSFTLEIHPTEGRLPLGDASHLFAHWTDIRNAERMNFWLSMILQNHLLLLGACTQSLERMATGYSSSTPHK